MYQSVSLTRKSAEKEMEKSLILRTNPLVSLVRYDSPKSRE